MTFYEWMMTQVRRKDEVGEVAQRIALWGDDMTDYPIGYWQAVARAAKWSALYDAIGEYENGQVN